MHNKLYGDQMLVRLLISIDRSKSLKENEETVELALAVRTRSEVIVGIDLSGNPLKGSFVNFIPLLQKCKNLGMFITVHTAEVPDIDGVRNEDDNNFELIQNEAVNGLPGSVSVVESDREGIMPPLMTETDSILHFR